MFNIIKFFTNYAKEVSFGRMIGHATILLIVTSWVGFVAIVVLNFNTISGMYVKYKTTTDIKINRALSVSEKVHDLITKQRIRLGVDRLYVSKFHNGKQDLLKIHFLYFSRIIESNNPVIRSELTRTQNLPLSIFPGMVTSISKGQCYHADFSDITAENGNFFTELGVKATTICPIYTTEGILIGLVGAEDVITDTVKNNNSKVGDSLKTLSGVLGDVLVAG